ncbi:unnamed protein product (macronuclear) [Paramecium tetraurelia]|uniref:HTH psq-type domain-containing protein n=1 Tax=Paramecium tetraurelia TaxID=5888 RepID=A0E6Q6_PARTE|nr:uncharacterized protein GSPATT00023701001 [Paramecium tetraurelia]CAK90973.1 unnamed protein product [Paramecium tetraurelia]|eukprot:XP_001458370.1 hypothetical protein (macronuclear) [Paramecium tetraurelia strain d4-2]
MKQDSKRHKTQYYKLSSELRQTLIHLICLKGKKIKQAAQQLNIKYSVAKSIFFYYRNNMIRNKQSAYLAKRCFYRTTTTKVIVYRIITQIAGEQVSSKIVHQTTTQISL